MIADRDAFVATYGPLFEHSPWVAEDAFEHGPFTTREALYDALVAAMYAAPRERQVALVRAHPELAGKVATKASRSAVTLRIRSDRARPRSWVLSGP